MHFSIHHLNKYSCLLILLSYCIRSAGQEVARHNVGLRVGLGNSISTRQFFADDLAPNFPTSGFVNVGLSTNLLERNARSLFLGVEMQAFNYYLSAAEKNNLAFISVLVGKTRKYDLSPKLYLKQTNGVSLNTLGEATSTNSQTPIYSGGFLKNLNLGAFSNLQLLFRGENQKNRNIDFGFGFDFMFRGLQLSKDKLYPFYMHSNYFLQYGLNINTNYNF